MPLFSGGIIADQDVAPDYTLYRSRRRTIAIHVHENRVEVRAPLKAAKRDIEAFVQQKKNWIAGKLLELEQRSGEALDLEDGQAISVMSTRLVLQWRVSSRFRMYREQDWLVVEGPLLDTMRVQKLFRHWLLVEAETALLPLARAVIHELGLASRSSGFSLRYTRSLWGRCSATGDILFNPFILLAPMRVITYLVAHEACHLRHMNHSPAFWQLVEDVCPDWQESRRWLRTHGHRLRVK